jgi:hypothetical protein
VGDRVRFSSDAPAGWRLSPSTAGFEVTSVSGKEFTISGLPPGLDPCDGDCGGVSQADYEVDFTLAGGSGEGIGTDYPFYTLHADFWNSWHQAALEKLEQYCLRGTSCGQGERNIARNADVDDLG